MLVAVLAAGCQQQPAGVRAVAGAAEDRAAAAPPGTVQPGPATRPTAPEPAPEEALAPEQAVPGETEIEQTSANRPAATEPAGEKPAAERGTADEEEARRMAELVRRLAERAPKRPQESWVVFREAFDEVKDATCTAEWTGGNRLEVHTENIKRLTLYLTRLPAGAPQRGPWNLQIDHQGIQITGFRGKILDLVRSKSGNWTVDLTKAKRRD